MKAKITSFTNSKFAFSVIVVFSLVVVLLSLHTGFFWDSISQVYKYGEWILQNHFHSFIPPNSFDIGIPPTFGLVYAVVWAALGQSLWLSHLVMLPFAVGLLWQLFLLVRRFVDNDRHVWLVYLLVVADPTLLSQLTLINFEVFHNFLFFGAINAILGGKHRSKALYLVFLGLVSYRGMMLCGSVFLFEVVWLWHRNQEVREWLKPMRILPYIIGAVPALSFIVWHYVEKGWMFGNSDSPWAGNLAMGNAKTLLRNLVVMAQRILDFGRIGVWGVFLVVFLKFFRNPGWLSSPNKSLVLMFVTSLFVVGACSVLINNPMGHRYFLAGYLVFALLTGCLVLQYFKYGKFVIIGLIGFLLLGNLWVYPRHISQGWDSSLAHLPYHNLRRQMIAYMDSANVAVDSTATFFPNKTVIHYIDLNGDKRCFADFTGGNSYVFYSNVYNLGDAELATLDSGYVEVKRMECGTVYIQLLKKK